MKKIGSFPATPHRQYIYILRVERITTKYDSTRENSIFRHKCAVFRVRAHNQMNSHELIIILLIINATNCFSHKFIKHFVDVYEKLTLTMIPAARYSGSMCTHDYNVIHVMIEMESVRNMRYQIANGIERFANQPNILYTI